MDICDSEKRVDLLRQRLDGRAFLTTCIPDADLRHHQHCTFLLEQIKPLQGSFDCFQPLAIQTLQMRQGCIKDRQRAGRRKSRLRKCQMVVVAVAIRKLRKKGLHKVFWLGVNSDLVILQVRLLGGVLDGVLQSADLIDQAEFQGLPTGEHAAGGQFVNRLLSLAPRASTTCPLNTP